MYELYQLENKENALDMRDFILELVLYFSATSVVLGGTAYKDDFNLEVEESDRKHILEGTQKLLPSLKVNFVSPCQFLQLL